MGLIRKKNIYILATGGTIAGLGKLGKNAQYKPGAIPIDDILNEIPELESVANVVCEQICNINSDDITSEIWCNMARRIDQLAARPDVDGFVITHGTDTMEETAYFLNLVLHTKKPVVITGSMRPQSSISPDGPLNLFESVQVAASPKAYGAGVLCVFSDMIYHSRDFTKTSTFSVNAMSSISSTAVGYVRDNIVYFYNNGNIDMPETVFDVSKTDRLPDVGIVFFHVDARPQTLQYELDHSDGIVISGAGAGEYSQLFADVIAKTNKPVVITSHSGNGMIVQQSMILPDKTIATDFITPQKAAILLRLILLNYPKATHQQIIKFFETY